MRQQIECAWGTRGLGELTVIQQFLVDFDFF
ncbi:Uncharacterised protein [Vibrio cholerae]|nr:Uncharacterised protein [Vibrio cholerae]CSH82474.1 Uncharacterised protein [Vibrio cholerae]